MKRRLIVGSAALCLGFLSAWADPVVPDLIGLGGDSATPGRPIVRLKGAVGEKADRLFAARLTSPRARGDVFEETVRAFRTKYDDRHPVPNGKGRTAYWQGEYWGKGMLSHCAYARMTGDGDAIAFIRRKALELVREFQREDGYLATYDDADYVKDSWNIWGRKYTMWALVEAYDLTGEKELIDAAVKMVRHLDSQLRRLGLRLSETGCFAGLPSMSILKPLLLVYERTRDPVALTMAKDIIAENDRKDGACPNLIANAFSDKPLFAWYSNPRSWAKAYEMMSTIEGFILYSEITGEERPFEAAKRLFAKLSAEERNGVGSVGSHDHFYGARRFPNAISESCDVIHWMRLCKYLHARTRDPGYLDKWEVAFLNAFLAGIYRDGTWGTHDVRGHGRRHLQGLFEVGMYYHFCCLANDPRGFCDWAEGFVRAQGKDSFDLNFYTDGEFDAEGVRIAVSGNYPINERITVQVETERPLSLGLRVPGWCEEMRVNDRLVTGPRTYVQVPSGGATFDLRFAMTPRLEAWTSDFEAPDPDLVRAAAKKDFEMAPHNPEMIGSARTEPGVRLLRGPLILAKCARAGGNDREVLSDIGIDESWTVRLEPVANDAVWGCWRAFFEKGGEKKAVGVSDYQSAADTDDWRNAFSIWF